MAEGIQIRLTHLGRVLPSPPYQAGTTRTSSLYIDDLRSESLIRGLTAEAFYIPAGGYIDLTFTGPVAKSYENGDIRNLLDQGEISAEFVYGTGGRDGADGNKFLTNADSPFSAENWHPHFYVDTSNGPVTIILPYGLTSYNKRVKVIDIGGNASANNITVTAYSSATPLIDDQIDGGANTQIITDFGFFEAAYLDPVPPAVNGDWNFITDINVVAPPAPAAAPRYTVVGATAPGPYGSSSGDFVEANASGGAFQVDLPAAALAGDVVIVKKIDASANIVTVDGNGSNIDGAASTLLNVQYESLTFVKGSAQWWVE